MGDIHRLRLPALSASTPSTSTPPSATDQSPDGFSTGPRALLSRVVVTTAAGPRPGKIVGRTFCERPDYNVMLDDGTLMPSVPEQMLVGDLYPVGEGVGSP